MYFHLFHFHPNRVFCLHPLHLQRWIFLAPCFLKIVSEQYLDLHLFHFHPSLWAQHSGCFASIHYTSKDWLFLLLWCCIMLRPFLGPILCRATTHDLDIYTDMWYKPLMFWTFIQICDTNHSWFGHLYRYAIQTTHVLDIYIDMWYKRSAVASSFQLSGLSEVGKLLAEAVYQFLFLPASIASFCSQHYVLLHSFSILYILIDFKFMKVSIWYRLS